MTDYSNDFKRLGHPGKWKGVILQGNNSVREYTGSNFGAGGIMLSGDAAGEDGTTIEFTGGGTIDGSELVAGTIYEFSIKKVTLPDNTQASASIFIRNNRV